VTHTYTRYIKTLRLVLPVIAAISLLALLIWPWWQEKQQLRVKKAASVAAATSDASVSNAPLQVHKPEYQGLDRSGRPYHITAERVEQSLDPKAPLLLTAPLATLTLRDDTDNRDPQAAQMTLRATHGLYDMQAQIIDLKGEVTFDYAGYTVITQDLALDMLASAATTSSPISGSGPRGTLEAQQLTIADKGHRIVLKGPSRIIFHAATPSSVTTP
jgi:lipopolysaccharide export system protein LptC